MITLIKHYLAATAETAAAMPQKLSEYLDAVGAIHRDSTEWFEQAGTRAAAKRKRISASHLVAVAAESTDGSWSLGAWNGKDDADRAGTFSTSVTDGRRKLAGGSRVLTELQDDRIGLGGLREIMLRGVTLFGCDHAFVGEERFVISPFKTKGTQWLAGTITFLTKRVSAVDGLECVQALNGWLYSVRRESDNSHWRIVGALNDVLNRELPGYD